MLDNIYMQVIKGAAEWEEKTDLHVSKKRSSEPYSPCNVDKRRRIEFLKELNALGLTLEEYNNQQDFFKNK